MWDHALLAMAVIMTTATANARQLELAKDGQTSYVIAKGAAPTPAEEFAAQELSDHLLKVTGARFAVVPETDLEQPRRAIYVGWTDFARAHGIGLPTLGDEEWVIRTVNEGLVLTGGRPRGTLYAVYELLEQQIGCHWFDQETQTIPSRPTLVLDLVDVRDRPAFSDRHIYTGIPDFLWYKTLRVRNKDTRPTLPKFGFGNGLGSHTFYQYSREFPPEHPEYLAMDESGNRPVATGGSGPGQICLTHPEVRKLMLTRLRKLIAADHDAVAKAVSEGRRSQRVYFVEQNDSHWACQCPACRAFAEREGSDSGPLLDLVNSLAEGIRDDAPGILVETFAYTNTLSPPKNVRPHDNVMIRLAQLNAEWSTDARGKSWSADEYPDLFRPMNHPVNRYAHERLESWSKIAKHLAYWDYWVQYSPNDKFASPYTNTHCLQPDLRLFRDSGVEWLFVEREESQRGSFHALTCWLGWKLMQDPDQDREALIKVFMDGVYGPAAGKMTEYLHHLEQAIAAVPPESGKLSAMKTSQRPYLTLAFYKRCQQLLDEAEALCRTDAKALSKVRSERIPVDVGLFCMWNKLRNELAAGEAMPWNQESILERYATCRMEQTRKKDPKALEKDLLRLRGLASTERKSKPPPSLRVPRLANQRTTGDPAEVDWTRAAAVRPWLTMYGAELPDRKIEGAVAHDGRFFYISLEEAGIDPANLSETWWAGDGWELFLSASSSGFPYRQFAVNATGEHLAYEYGDGRTTWDSQAIVTRDSDGTRWRTLIAIPLSNLCMNGAGSGQTLYVNIFRVTSGTGVTMCWSPIFESAFHDMSRLATLTLE